MWIPGIRPVIVPAIIPRKMAKIIWINTYWKDLIIEKGWDFYNG